VIWLEDEMGGVGDFMSVPECVPARMLNEFTYCPRLAYMEWVQGDFASNYEVEDGRLAHRVVDKESGYLPDSKDDEKFRSRSVWMSAPSDALTARMDLVEGSGKVVTVVDYKRGSPPDNPERSWENDRVQLCAQALVLKANGFECDAGFIYYVESKTRVSVLFADDLIQRTRDLVHDFKRIANEGKIPPPLENSPKCIGCSMAGICLPDETNLIAESDGSADPGSQEVRRLVPARDTAIPLYVQHQGASIARRGECFEIREKRSKLGEARIFETSQVAVFGNVQVTTQALREMCCRGIPLTLFSTGGWFYGIAQGMPHKNVELRRLQYEAFTDERKCLPVASEMIRAKIRNCRTLLMRNHSQLPRDAIVSLSRLAQKASSTRETESLLGIEGAAASLYFSLFSGMLKTASEQDSDRQWTFDFTGRNRRPPLDPINAMLSYAYSLLAKDLSVTALAVGFDPFMGLYHKPRYGRPALALDIMEEFRPIIADSVVLSVANNKVVSPADFIRRGPAVAFKPAARKKFIQAYERRMDSLITHPLFGYRISYRRVLEVQTRLLARVVSGELHQYPAFLTR
jgi:CRISPR-associated protein Cas1